MGEERYRSIPEAVAGYRKEKPTRPTGQFSREHFEEDLDSMIKTLDNVTRSCEYWSERLRRLPALPLEKSTFVAHARISLDRVRKDGETAIKLLKEIKSDVWRYTEEL